MTYLKYMLVKQVMIPCDLIRGVFRTPSHCTKNEISIKDFFCKCDQIRRFLQIWSHLLRKSLMENFILRTLPDMHARAFFDNFTSSVITEFVIKTAFQNYHSFIPEFRLTAILNI